ncbi:MAG TPA: hypothetical protein VJ809_06535 [Pirellulales bacterium]|nr:hypothetical protein [Pirellulales bacterium]
MKSNHQSPIWPYLLVLAALFALCVTAPRGWQTKPTAHRARPAQREISLAQQKPRSQTPIVLRADSSSRRGDSVGRLAATQSADGSAQMSPPSVNPLAAADATFPESSIADEPSSTRDVSLLPDLGSSTQPPVTVPESSLFVSVDVDESTTDSFDGTSGQDRELFVESAAKARAVEEEPSVAARDGSDEVLERNYDNWPLPVALIDRLAQFEELESTRRWARDIRSLVDQLASLRLEDSAATTVLARLRVMGEQQQPVAEKMLAAAEERDLEQLQLDLQRRVALWEKAAQASGAELVAMTATEADTQMQQALVKIAEMLDRAPVGDTWRNFLMLTRLNQLARDTSDDALPERRHVAEIVLARMADSRLTSAQKRLLAEPALAELKRNLRRWTVEKLPLGELLYTVEDYEQARVTSLGRTLSEQSELLSASQDAAEKRLGSELARQYRNANLRVVVTRELLNRLLPQPAPALEPVNDSIVGVVARGQSTTSAKLLVRLFPANDQIRFGIEAAGVVDSQTASSAGPVTFFSQGESSYRVGKLVVIDRNGIRVGNAMADADDRTRLSGLQTDFDAVPIVRNLVRGYALSQHDEKQGQARQEVEAKVASRASQRLDAEVNARLIKAEEDIRRRILAPLQKLELIPQIVQLTTTEERVTARLRLAGADQAGAHTPRPLAMSDSLASLQIHETAINNALDRFQLAGRTFTLPELYEWIGGLLGRMRVELPEDLPEQVSITFAEKDPLRVRCTDGRVELTLAVAELDEGRRAWHDFQITVFYRPHREGLRLEFAREGAIELSGEAYKGRTEVVLRGIFAKVFSHRRKLTFDPASENPNPALATLAFSTALVDNGWISITVADAKAAGERR